MAANTLTYKFGLSVYGNVHLILADGCQVTVNEGIMVECSVNSGENSLSIYAQSEGEDMGALIATSKTDHTAAIGGTSGTTDIESVITIHGGAVTACADYTIFSGIIVTRHTEAGG